MSLSSTPYAVVMGLQAGYTGQSTGAVAIGFAASATGQRAFAVSVGPSAAITRQGTGAVAIGYQAAAADQAMFSVVIGPFAGQSTAGSGSIILNASQTALNASASGLFIRPLNVTTNDALSTLLYDSSSQAVVQRPLGSTATRLNVYPMLPVMPQMTAQTTAGDFGNYTVTASSEFSAAYAGWKAFSQGGGDWATLGATTNIWLQVKLPVSRNVAFVWFQGRQDSVTEYPVTFRMQGSNDGITFTDINSTLTCGSAAQVTSTPFVIPSGSRNYLYYRFFFPTTNGPNPGLSGYTRMQTHSTTAYPNSVNSVRWTPQGGYNFGDIIRYGSWGFSFTSRGGYVLVEVSMAGYAATTFSQFTINAYLDGTYVNRVQFTNWVPQWSYMNGNYWKQMPTYSFGALLAAGDHVISFDSPAGANFANWDTNMCINFNVIEIL